MKRYDITAEMIKAIRLVKGYKTDLRRDISAAVNRDCMYDFIDSIFTGLFGIEMLDKKHDEDGLLSDSYEKAIWNCVNCVCSGHPGYFNL